jgi:hypothetical protein
LVLLVELGTLRSLLRKPENLAILAVGAAYLGAVLWLTPEYLGLVGSLGRVYTDYRQQSLLGILFGRFEALVAWLALAMYIVYRKALETGALTDLLAVCTVGALVGLGLQGKGFDYHYYPALGFSLVLLWMVRFSAPVATTASRKRARAFAGGLLVIASSPFLLAGLRIGLGPEHSEMRAYRALEKAVGPVHGRSLLVLAPRSGYAFGLVTYAGARWVGRFPCMWVPPVLYQSAVGAEAAEYRGPGEMPPVERWFRSSVVADAVRARPDLILVGIPTPGRGPRDYWFDLLEYFTRDSRFARLMTEYTRAGESVGYIIYRRKV